jgi:peptide/nickel transport system substrate-binding protein
MKPRISTRPQRTMIMAVAVGAALLLAACGGSPAVSTGSTAQGSITVSGNTPGPVTRSFNPFEPTSGGQLLDATPYVYEPLLQFNLLRAGQIYPWLAASYHLTNGGKTLIFDLHRGVKWSDGTPFTSKDVVFTFDLLKKFPALNTTGVKYQTITANGPYQVTFTFAQPSYPELYYIGQVYMVPEHIWSKVSNPVKWADANPVGTGPYLVSSFSPQQLTLTKNPHYWQAGKPEVSKLIFPAYSSADSSNLALEQGDIQWAGNYIPDVKKTYIAPDPTYRHYWFAPVGGVALLPNLTVAPLNNVDVRQAISLAINRQQVSTLGETGYEAPYASPTGLVLPDDQSFMAPQYASMRFTVNDTRAKQLLKQAGLKMGSNGYFETSSGNPITLTIEDPSSYSDYMTDAQIIKGNLKAIGINTAISGVSVNSWTTDLETGNFQLSIDYSNIGPDPYYVYDGWLDDSLSAPVGKTASSDFSRWYSPTTQKYLADYVHSTSAAQRTAAIQGVEGIMVKDMPVIPLVYSAVWYQWYDKYWTGWPTPSDPYIMGEPAGVQSEVVVLRLHPRS